MGTTIWNWLESISRFLTSLFTFTHDILFTTVYYGKFYEGTWHSVPVNLFSVFTILGVGVWLTLFILKVLNVFS